jgi:cytidine deaminase
MDRVNEVLYSIINIHNRYYPQSVLSREKLMNMMYLCDRKSIKKTKKPYRLTNITYVNYSYGPYSKTVVESIISADSDHIFHEFEERNPNESYYYYELCNCPERSVETDLNNKELRIITEVVIKFGSMEKTEISKYVRSLEEVEKTKKYGKIDLEKVSTNCSSRSQG